MTLFTLIDIFRLDFCPILNDATLFPNFPHMIKIKYKKLIEVVIYVCEIPYFQYVLKYNSTRIYFYQTLIWIVEA